MVDPLRLLSKPLRETLRNVKICYRHNDNDKIGCMCDINYF